jgi:Xaa-Pro aminopeptidase
MFPERRSRFLDALGPDAVAIVAGARLVTRSNDTEYPFRQNSDFWYLTGFDHPDAVAIFRTTDGPDYTLYVQPRDRSAEVWTGYRPGVDGAVADHQADEAHEIGELIGHLPDVLAGASRIYHSLGRLPEADTKLIEVQESLRLRNRAGIAPANELIDPRGILHEMRMFKEPAELAIMRRAAEISRVAHHEAAQLAWPGRYEYELEARLDYAFRRQGGRGAAYSSIVAGGANAAVLHYITNDMPLREGEMVLIDAGTELEGYASDITRTYPIGGRFEGAGRAVYDVVLAAQEAVLEAVKPGTTLPALHQIALRIQVEGMLELGLLEGEAAELIEKEAYQRFYMHGTSHWLGLDVHDCGSYSTAGEPRKLEPGMVFTVEPGIYIARDDEQAPEALRGIGVRIEDDVVVTPDGCENLTGAIPKRPDEVAAQVLEGQSSG